MRGVVLAALMLLLVGAAQGAEPSILLRTGVHPGYDRVVFDLPLGTVANPVRQGDRLVIRFAPAAPVSTTSSATHNLRDISVAPGKAELTLAPGTRIRRMRLAGRLVIDVLDPAYEPEVKPEVKPAAAKTAKAAREPVLPAGMPTLADKMDPPAAPAAPGPVEHPSTPAPTVSVVPPVLPVPAVAPTPIVPAPQIMPADATAGPPAEPMQLAATAPPLPPGEIGRAVLLPFDADVGAAAFRRGADALVIFDQRKPIDMSGLQGDPTLAAAQVQLLPAGTVLRMQLAPQEDLQLTRAGPGWTVTIRPGNAGPDSAPPGMNPAITPDIADGVVRLPVEAPGRIVSVPDPRTGLMLLVGTQRRPGRKVVALRRYPQFVLPPTWLGVVVEPVADSLSVRTTSKEMVIEGDGGRALALSAPTPDVVAAADARHFSRRFDFPGLAIERLRQRLVAAVDSAAATPVQGRAGKRLAVAQDMIGLGMGAEAQSVLMLAATNDGRMADDPTLLGLSAVAALITGRPTEAAGIDDPRLTGTDEVALWRAARAAARQEGAPDAAAAFAANLPLLLSYPEPLRRRLLPLAAETMALGGEQAVAQRLLDERPGDASLDLARGFALQAEGGDPKAALAVYDRLAQGPDQLAHARAATQAVKLRLASGALTPAQAADALDGLMYSWRGDWRELALREQEADLRRQAGQWRPALALLRETEQVFPDRRPALQAKLAEIFSDALANDAKTPMPPLDLVALAEENADLIPPGEAGQALAERLADRLTALDLPARAIPVLAKLADQAPAGPVRAQFGGRLAKLDMDQGDAAAALAALTRSGAPDLPAPLLESRTLTFARAAAAAGDLSSATAALAALGTSAAKGLRADLLETAKDWPAAEAALRDVASGSIPADGTLDDGQARLMLRLASAAAQVGDEATLADLRVHTMPRLPGGKLADMFRVLTAGPVSGVADLPRAERETKLAGGLSASLKSLAPK